MSDFELDNPHDELQDAMSDPAYVAAADADYAETIRIQAGEENGRIARIVGELEAVAEMDATMSAAAAVQRGAKWQKYDFTYHGAELRSAWTRFSEREPIASLLDQITLADTQPVKDLFGAAYWLQIVREAQIPLPLYPEKQAS